MDRALGKADISVAAPFELHFGIFDIAGTDENFLLDWVGDAAAAVGKVRDVGGEIEGKVAVNVAALFVAHCCRPCLNARYPVDRFLADRADGRCCKIYFLKFYFLLVEVAENAAVIVDLVVVFVVDVAFDVFVLDASGVEESAAAAQSGTGAVVTSVVRS